MDSLYIVMPAYNEEKNIENVIRQWYPMLEGKSENSRLVVADSGSTDNTHAILEKMRLVDFPQLEIITDTNRYHGPKLVALYDYAIKNDIDYIFQTDSDGQTNSEEFEAFWNLRKEYTGVFGNRVVRGDGKDRAFVEKVVCILVRLIFGVNVPDANAPFRLMNSKIVKKYLYNLDKDFELPNIMMTTFYAYYNEPILFKEISFKSRTAGRNHINYRRIIKIGIKAIGDFARIKRTCIKRQN